VLDDVGVLLELLAPELLVLELLVLDVPAVPVVTVDACEAVALWLARTATAPVPAPVIASSPMVAIATRRLPSSLMLTAAPLVHDGRLVYDVCGWLPFAAWGQASGATLWTSCGLAECFLGMRKGLHSPHTATEMPTVDSQVAHSAA
jgi:hypothetical protein